MTTTSNEYEETHQDRAESWSEICVVISSAFPRRESVSQKVIISLSAFSTQDGSYQPESRKSVTCSFGSSFDLSLAGTLGDIHAWLLRLWLSFAGGLVGNELLLDLVGMQNARPLLVGLVDIVLVRIGLNFEEVVEGYSYTFMTFDLIAQAEDFLICTDQLARD